MVALKLKSHPTSKKKKISFIDSYFLTAITIFLSLTIFQKKEIMLFWGEKNLNFSETAVESLDVCVILVCKEDGKTIKILSGAFPAQ